MSENRTLLYFQKVAEQNCCQYSYIYNQKIHKLIRWRFGCLFTSDNLRTLNYHKIAFGISNFAVRHLVGEKKSGKWDSNPRPSAWKADALIPELLPHKIELFVLPCKIV